MMQVAEVWDYDADLLGDAMDTAADCHQTGWTVCGAEDPAVIALGKEFGEMHPALAGYEYLRVIDKYVNHSMSDTLLEFSNREMTEEEYAQYEQIAEEEQQGGN